MSYQKNKSKGQPAPRENASMKDYSEVTKSMRDWYAEHNVSLARLERVFYPETHGIRWTATIEVGFLPDRFSPVIVALQYANLCFVGIYEPKAWELRGKANPTFEISWYTNEPSV